MNWYHSWHKHPFHAHIHWGAFLVISLFTGFLIVDFISHTYLEAETQNIVSAQSCSQPHVQAAIDASVSGNTVVVPAGDCTWSTYATIPAGKNITLQGAGSGSTIITASPTNTTLIFIAAGFESRVTGFTFTCGLIRPLGSGWRFDHNVMTCPSFTHGLWAKGQSKLTNPKGLVDHNTFINSGVLIQGYPGVSLSDLDGSTQWSDPLALGTDEALYVEDNNFNFNVFGNAMDCNYGGRYVFRHNTVTGTSVEAHSVQSTNRSCRKWEIYENNINQSGGVAFTMFLRGGTGVVYNNTMSGTFATPNITLDNRRSFSSVATFNKCDGSSAWDGNTEANGWPCRDQIGRGKDATPFSKNGFYIEQTLDPAYFWNNTWNGVAGGVVVANGSDIHIKPNRDYFVNTGAKPGYTAYTYPHPLASGAAAPIYSTPYVTPYSTPYTTPTTPTTNPTTPNNSGVTEAAPSQNQVTTQVENPNPTPTTEEAKKALIIQIMIQLIALLTELIIKIKSGAAAAISALGSWGMR